jgi:hypothetical protein
MLTLFAFMMWATITVGKLPRFLSMADRAAPLSGGD